MLIFRFPTVVDAVLSQLDQIFDVIQFEQEVVDEENYGLKMNHDLVIRFIPFVDFIFKGQIGGRLHPLSPSLILPSSLILRFLFLTAFTGLIIFATSFSGFFFAMNLPTSEGTSEIIAADIAGMGKEKYSTVFACFQAGLQFRSVIQQGVDKKTISVHESANFAPLMPFRIGIKKFLYFYNKKAIL